MQTFSLFQRTLLITSIKYHGTSKKYFKFPSMTEDEFKCARRIADRTSPPDTAFGIIVALACVEPQLQASRLAQMLDVHITAISLTANSLEQSGVLLREWAPAKSTSVAPPGAPRSRGRSRLYSLTPRWIQAAPSAVQRAAKLLAGGG
jgi:hypothetical protein